MGSHAEVVDIVETLVTHMKWADVEAHKPCHDDCECYEEGYDEAILSMTCALDDESVDIYFAEYDRMISLVDGLEDAIEEGNMQRAMDMLVDWRKPIQQVDKNEAREHWLK